VRLALLSDVHGNAAALEAVLDDLRDQTYDGVVFLGDYALFGPRPAEAVDLVRAVDDAVCIVGNTDGYLQVQDTPVIEWTRDELGERVGWLGTRPFCHEVDGLLAVHATPTDVEAVLIVEPHPHGDLPLTAEDDAEALLGGAQADLIVYGHIHYASKGVVAGQRVASIGSVGFPYDGDPRAAYAFAERTDAGWRLEHRRVEYGHKAVAGEIRTRGMPLSEPLAQRILQARGLPLA